MCIRMSRGNTCRIVFTGRAKSPRRGWTRCGRTRDGSASHGSCIREPTASSVPHVARVAATCSRSVRGRIDNCASLFSRVFHLVRFAVESIWLPSSILREGLAHTSSHERRPKLCFRLVWATVTIVGQLRRSLPVFRYLCVLTN